MGRKRVTKNFLDPVILKEGTFKLSDVGKLKEGFEVEQTLDIFKNQLRELYKINNPSATRLPEFETKVDMYIRQRMKSNKLGSWVCFPWKKLLVHSVNREEYFLLRTNRNRNLITKSEQKILERSSVGVVGLSIGSSFARNLVQQGISRNLKLAEYDVLETTNMNRMFASISDLGEPKLSIISKHLYELDPYWKLHLFENGLNDDNLEDFMRGTYPLDLIFEAIDDLKMKIKIRLKAKKHKIPVVMFTNLGDSVMVDVERYDVDEELEIFNGLLGNVAENILNKEITQENVNKLVTQIVGKDNTPKRALDSLKLIGKELVGRPQLAGTVNISGGLSTFIARKILLRKELKSGRYVFKFDNILKHNQSSLDT